MDISDYCLPDFFFFFYLIVYMSLFSMHRQLKKSEGLSTDSRLDTCQSWLAPTRLQKIILTLIRVNQGLGIVDRVLSEEGEHNNKLNPTHFPGISGLVGRSAFLLGSDLRIIGGRMLSAIYYKPQGTGHRCLGPRVPKLRPID